MQNPDKITSFQVDHRKIIPGMYISRVDGDIVTYDLRHREPNKGNFLSPLQAHSMEHMFATYIRSGELKEEIIYFGPMGCLTGFYLLVRCHGEVDLNFHKKVRDEVISTLKKVKYATSMFGGSELECGNYRLLNLDCAKQEAGHFLIVMECAGDKFDYDA